MWWVRFVVFSSSSSRAHPMGGLLNFLLRSDLGAGRRGRLPRTWHAAGLHVRKLRARTGRAGRWSITPIMSLLWDNGKWVRFVVFMIFDGG